jgi:hypothetical protein
MIGGEFSPAVIYHGYGDNLLMFATEGGDVCVFNNDKRGLPDEKTMADPDFNAREYAEWGERRIAPCYYAFDRHAAVCRVTTPRDDCDAPNLTKSTEKHSLVIKCRCPGRGELICEAATDTRGYTEPVAFPGAAPDFSTLDFSCLIFDTPESVSIPFNEKEKGWVEKELSLYTDEYCAPIGIDSITYRYTVKGRIKNK